jgi:hypothetical protein
MVCNFLNLDKEKRSAMAGSRYRAESFKLWSVFGCSRQPGKAVVARFFKPGVGLVLKYTPSPSIRLSCLDKNISPRSSSLRPFSTCPHYCLSQWRTSSDLLFLARFAPLEPLPMRHALWLELPVGMPTLPPVMAPSTCRVSASFRQFHCCRVIC